jgi:hypothetical protein
MEDYTYHLIGDESLCLGSHMLEICPTIADGKPSCEIHPLGIGGKEDPVRLVFNTPTGPAVNAAFVDMGNRFRMVLSEVDVVAPENPLEKLPVARALWKPRPDLKTAAAAWIHAGGSHHPVFSQALTIHPDGTVDHRIDFLGRFSTPMDFQRFPFDTQRLKISIESFLEQTDQLRFVPNQVKTRADPDSAGGDLNLIGIRASVTQSAVSGWDENFSRYVLELAVERNVNFYIWRVIVPIMIIVMISFALFFVDIASYHDRVGIAMACLLACVATQFAISFTLPRISYLTPIDRFFVWTYISIGLGVALSTWVKVLEGRGNEQWRRIDFHSRWLSPLVFFGGVAIILTA